MTDPDDPRLLAAGFALGSLTARERAEYQNYLDSTPGAFKEADELQSTAARLGEAVQPVDPPARLKADIMARLGGIPQLPPLETAAAMDGLTTDPNLTTRATSRARARWFNRPVGILAAAAAAAVLFVGGTLVGIGINSGESFHQQQASALASINSAPDAQRTTATITGGGTATVVWSPEVGKSALLVDGLKSLPSDKTYELWYIAGDVPTPAGTMDPTENGTTWRVLEGELRPGATIGVTVEPQGGSKKPTTTPIVAIRT
ncbi:MAG: anti-sigma factor [Microbacteriaceae bacterium]